MALNFLLAYSLNTLWGMLNGIQLISHLPIYRLKVPANAEYFFEFMIQVATFDPLPIDAIWAVFTLPARDPYSDSFASSGYSYLFAVENFGSATVAIHLCAIAGVICLILPRISTSLTTSIVQHSKFTKFRNGIFFGGSLRFLFEGYLQMAVAICIGFLTLEWNSDSNSSVSYCNCFAILIGVVLAGLPVYIIVHYFKNAHRLDEEEF